MSRQRASSRLLGRLQEPLGIGQLLDHSFAADVDVMLLGELGVDALMRGTSSSGPRRRAVFADGFGMQSLAPLGPVRCAAIAADHCGREPARQGAAWFDAGLRQMWAAARRALAAALVRARRLLRRGVSGAHGER